MVQSTQVTGRKWTKVDQLTPELAGQKVSGTAPAAERAQQHPCKAAALAAIRGRGCWEAVKYAKGNSDSALSMPPPHREALHVLKKWRVEQSWADR